MAAPAYQAATAGQAPLAAHVNQLLGTHPTTYLYAAVQRAAQATAGTGNINSNGQYMAQSFSTAAGQTAVGYVAIQLLNNTNNGSNLAPTTVSIYANASGAPTGTPLISTTVTAEYANAGPVNLVIPTPVTGLTPSTTYWIVVAAAGNATYSYDWNKSNQASGASTSTNGTTWTSQTYGLLYQVFDQSATGEVTVVWADGGSRWVWFGYDGSQRITTVAEYTAGQTASGYLQAFRSLSYSPQGSNPGPNVIGVA